MNGLRSLVGVLERLDNEIHVDPAVAGRARISLGRMLDFSRQRRQTVLGLGDA